ncbi:GH25 family lysozyme [Flavobacterium aciduliphilum]|uniref:Lysozyme n=1 Tax=Flavobacterium aciduliphilum TaxID=1101402 RepID=A0A328YJ28_9FLAO|nr:GH25 family lysozyme [Flavobacterium aciduliphilum]RAR70216.1 lysozyme [Flavobacterium aciduliphilum]
MTLRTHRKKSVSRKSAKKKKRTNFWKWIFFLAVLLLAFGGYHYQEALLFYFSFKSDKTYKEERIAQARIYQILKAHHDLVFGFDVSQFQGLIHWEAIDSVEHQFPLQFVFIRATAGLDKTDALFNENWQQAKEHLFIRGAYHYYRPNENSTLQAKNFIQVVHLSKGDLPPVLDIEKLPDNQSIDSFKVGLKRWLKLVDDHFHVRPIIYTGEKYYNDFLKADFPEYTFWVANYNFFVENIKEDWLFWQFTERAKINGIESKVDLNIYNGTPKMLRYLTISNEVIE